MDNESMLRVIAELADFNGKNDYGVKDAIRDALATKMGAYDINENAIYFKKMAYRMVNIVFNFVEGGHVPKASFYPIFGCLEPAKFNFRVLVKKAFASKIGYQRDELNDDEIRSLSSEMQVSLSAINEVIANSKKIDQDQLGKMLVDFIIAYMADPNICGDYPTKVFYLASAISAATDFGPALEPPAGPPYKTRYNM